MVDSAIRATRAETPLLKMGHLTPRSRGGLAQNRMAPIASAGIAKLRAGAVKVHLMMLDLINTMLATSQLKELSRSDVPKRLESGSLCTGTSWCASSDKLDVKFT